ncbi:MAG: low temperature requirement protein A [Blautia sp.]|nr:low temperature requirement protein A [Blautia sp.]
MKNVEPKKEKKVEYLELIYDLIFVYVIGRNNLLMHHVTDGFVEKELFIAYILCTLTVIQIWSFSTYYINMYGRNGLRDHISLFINMYLLYFIGKGTRINYAPYETEHHIAWGLILVNLGVQYFIEMRNHKDEPAIRRQTLKLGIVIITEALLVFITVPFYDAFGVNLVPYAILFGMLGTMVQGFRAEVILVDFAHLTERMMLYIVFTFGEMIITLADYFEGGISANTIYFSLMGFLIVAGLFLSYETIYDRLIDREADNDGLLYILLHIILIFALNIITISLDYMQNTAVSLWPKMWLLIIGFLMYYAALFCTLRYSKAACTHGKKLFAALGAAAVCFAILMITLREFNAVHIALTTGFVFGIWLVLFKFSRETGGRFLVPPGT